MRFWRERGRGGWGCGAEHRQWRMQRGGASVAVEKIEQASSAKIFSGTARRQGLRFAEECAAESHAAETVGKTSSYLPRRPLPRCRGGVGGAEPSAASGGCSEAEHPQRSKKSSKRAARRFFRAPQGGGGKCACGYLGSVSVRSTDLDFSFKKNLNSYPALQATERGLSRGNLSPLTVFCLLLHEQK